MQGMLAAVVVVVLAVSCFARTGRPQAGATDTNVIAGAVGKMITTGENPKIVLDSAVYGDPNFLMRIEEIERNARTSKLRVTYKTMGSSVGSSMFITQGFYEVAKSLGAKYFIELKEWDDPEGGWLYIVGFTDTRKVNIQEEFGDEYAATDCFGQARDVVSVAELSSLFEVAILTDEERAEVVHKSKIYRGDINAATNEMERFEALCAAIDKAKNLSDLHNARELAVELERLAPKYKETSSYGNAIQDSNQVLGRMALAEGNSEQAKQRLLASADSDGSPTMCSFGPNMTLARELLLKGERDVVLEYFDKCREFWKGHSADLDSWTEDVKAGRIPNFGPNLRY